MKFRIRYNQSAGQPGRGSIDHKWRIFDENDKEYICKEVIIHCSSWTEKDPNGNNWNMVCIGRMEIDKEISTIHIF
jgi:hypothetical protein